MRAIPHRNSVEGAISSSLWIVKAKETCVPAGDTRVFTYAIPIADELCTAFLVLTKAGGAKAVAEATKKAEARAVNFI
jgi:hypothetical protein